MSLFHQVYILVEKINLTYNSNTRYIMRNAIEPRRKEERYWGEIWEGLRKSLAVGK